MKGLPDDYIKGFIEKYPEVMTVVDTSGDALQEVYQARPSLIKINNEELKDIYPELDEESPEAILGILKEVTPHENIIITMGDKSNLAKIGQCFFRIQSPKKEACNPIAAGDFYLGLLVKGISQGQYPRSLFEGSGSLCNSQLFELFSRG
ncbi:PfkB family carbohydrate kinase [Streptococcus suis]|nr:PfkB family carbohydrate kinase [Streptococcus suis]